MEDTLRGNGREPGAKVTFSLNPYYNGRYSPSC